MERHTLPALRRIALCLKCGTPVPYETFESGFEDVDTLQGRRTGDLYRVSLSSVVYKTATREELLQPALQREGGLGLRHIPTEVRCPSCGSEFDATTAQHVPGVEEVSVSAHSLPCR